MQANLLWTYYDILNIFVEVFVASNILRFLMKFCEFMKTKQSRRDITSRYQPVARLDLFYVSENEGFGDSPNTHF